MESISSLGEFQDLVAGRQAVALYCSTPSCGVCASLKPKVAELFGRHFPSMELFYADIEALPELRGQLSVYSIPAVLGYFQGKELIREARNFGVAELGRKVDRYYSLLFGEAEDAPGEAEAQAGD